MSWKIVRSDFKAALGRQMAWPQNSLSVEKIIFQLVVYAQSWGKICWLCTTLVFHWLIFQGKHRQRLKPSIN